MKTTIKPGTIVINKMTGEPAFVLDITKETPKYSWMSGDMLTIRRALNLEEGLKYTIDKMPVEEYDTQEAIKEKALSDYLAFEAGKEAATAKRDSALPTTSH